MQVGAQMCAHSDWASISQATVAGWVVWHTAPTFFLLPGKRKGSQGGDAISHDKPSLYIHISVPPLPPLFFWVVVRGKREVAPMFY